MALRGTVSAAPIAGPLILPAPAKLNLFLHILGRRPDGYHRLQTLFQLLDYGDELELSTTPDGEIAVVVEPLLRDVPMTANLAYRAALALREHRPGPEGARILIRKRLPLGGGLGGGSSDAATVLVGLNRLWELNLGVEELCGLGLRLGADVPVFILGRSAWGEGIGEQLTPLDLPPAWYLVLKPDCDVATAAVFAHPQLTRHTRAMKIRAFSGEGAANDCQSVVETMYPQVREARLWLARYAQPRLTGTGACLFARFGDRESARATLAEIPAVWSGFIAQGVNISPLRQT
ncbi:MAG: 4-(cytidine 5'-diphospho)-2-C-methyl-D-erythritol kinase [Gammaproteobacteria bacterium]|nr:4-(cytidine 5'-diphospho)-2-C-methyl-D-erythritol kinase [Gammaproteobacteria bacterium]